MLKRIATSAMNFAPPHAEIASDQIADARSNKAAAAGQCEEEEEDDGTKRGSGNTRQWSARFKFQN